MNTLSEMIDKQIALHQGSNIFRDPLLPVYYLLRYW